MNILDILTRLTELMLQVQTSTPLVFGAIHAISFIWKGVTGEDVDLRQLADELEAKIEDRNIPNIQARIAKLRAMMGEVPSNPSGPAGPGAPGGLG